MVELKGHYSVWELFIIQWSFVATLHSCEVILNLVREVLGLPKKCKWPELLCEGIVHTIVKELKCE